MLFRSISLDLDGTLLDPAGQITPAAKEAIARAKAAGIRVVINTGRPAQEAFGYVREGNTDTLVSILGGAAVVDSVSGQVLRRWDIPASAARRTLELCLNRKIALMIFAGGQIVTDPHSKGVFLQTYPSPAFHEHAIVAEDPAAYLEEHRLLLTKIHGEGDPKTFPLEELSALEGLTLTSSGPRDFEVVGCGVDKGRALALIATLYGVPLEQCAAVGDSGNDLEALRAVGMPIAMGNASQAVKDAALRVVSSNREEGAAQAVLSCLE